MFACIVHCFDVFTGVASISDTCEGVAGKRLLYLNNKLATQHQHGLSAHAVMLIFFSCIGW